MLDIDTFGDVTVFLMEILIMLPYWRDLFPDDGMLECDVPNLLAPLTTGGWRLD